MRRALLALAAAAVAGGCARDELARGAVDLGLPAFESSVFEMDSPTASVSSQAAAQLLAVAAATADAPADREAAAQFAAPHPLGS